MQVKTIIDLIKTKAWGESIVHPDPEATVLSITEDSRQIMAGTLFVAIKGDKLDGHRFILTALEKGAIAVLAEYIPEEVKDTRRVLVVKNTRLALAELAALWHHHPMRHLPIIGVTGTNGKTTSTFLLYHLLTALGQKTGLIGTIAYRIGELELPSTHTTPDAMRLNRFVQDMVDAQCQTCVMEVSSHALDQYRVLGREFKVAVFSNLTHDHLDYHGTFAHYFASKKRLFDDLPATSFALYNADDPNGKAIVADTQAQVWSYGQTPDADISFEILENKVTGLVLRLDGQVQSFKLVGAFNAYNLAAAYGVGRALGFSSEALLSILGAAQPVPGRFEQITFKNDVTAIVDYAHTPDALENVLKTIHAVKEANARIWCVFGCGGDRDPAKRPVMGQIAEQYADFPIATSDNPRTEDPDAILADIRTGIQTPEKVTWITDRRAAIQHAAQYAQAGDLILIAGKGHETYQILGTTKHHFDDREEVIKAMGNRS